MNRITSPRTIVALGIATAIAMAAGIQVSSAQTAPRALPNLQNQQDPQYDPNDRQYGGQQYGGQQYGGQEFGGQPNVRDGRGFQNPQDRLERRLAFLHTRLRITPAQERGWTALVTALRDEEQQGNRGRGRDVGGRRDTQSVVERLERREQRMADGTQRLDHILGALRPLYASFSEEQKRTADRLMFTPGRERGMRDGRRGDDRGGPNGRFEDRQDRNSR